MSVEAISWASKQRTGSPGAKLVLIALANYANERNECWPSQATMAEWTEQSDRTIRTHLAALESMGLIHRQAREVAGAFTSDLITLNVAQRQILPAEKISDGRKQQIPTEKFSGNPSKEPSVKKTKTGTQLPEGFQPGDTHREMAAEGQIDLAREFAAFTDYHHSKGSVFKDWDAALRTWLRNAQRFQRGRAPVASFAGNARPEKFNPTAYVNDPQYRAAWDAKKQGGSHGAVIDVTAERVA